MRPTTNAALHLEVTMPAHDLTPQSDIAAPTLRAADADAPSPPLPAPTLCPVPGLLFGPEPETAPTGQSPLPDVLRRTASNDTGLPDRLKAGLESMSGIDLSAIRVHYNSDKPADIGALAYTRGTDIHLRASQEEHLPHEAWHVVQQLQGRVPRSGTSGELVENDDLETEADMMGDRAAGGDPGPVNRLVTARAPAGEVVQAKLEPDTTNEDLLRDLKVKKSQRDIVVALRKMMTEIRKMAITIQYDDVLTAVRGVGLNADKIGKIPARLEKQAAATLDEELSGGRGHMMGRHYAVDAKSQTKRAKEERKPRVTRIDKDKSSGHQYMNYVTRLKKRVPQQLRDHVKDTATVLFRDMQDEGWTDLNQQGKKQRLTGRLNDLQTEIEYDGWEITYVWTVRVAANGTTLTCAPEIESNRTFSKIETTLDGEKTSEAKAMDALNMFWGSNKLVITGLDPTLTDPEFNSKIDEIDFSKLGVTQF